MNSKKMQSNLMLLLTAFIWGVAFVAQSVGMDYVGPFTFNSVRNFIGAFVLLLFIPLLDKVNRQSAATVNASNSDAASANGCVDNANLLKRTGNCQKDTADNTADDQCFLVRYG